MWWDNKWGKDKICGITYSRIRPGKTKSGIPYSVHLSCGHYFYTNALIEWTKKSPSCPICRQRFDIFEEVLGVKIEYAQLSSV